MKKIVFKLFLVLFISGNLFAQGGMWLPNLLEGDIEKDMQKLGMKFSAKDIYNAESSSYKDAIVQFGGGCTAEIISPKGLLLTNHHCGYGNIQRLSTVENNLLKNGYWAKSFEEELPAPGLKVTFVDRIEDVTAIILTGVEEKMAQKESQSIIDKNIDSLKKSTPIEAYQQILIKPFYYGNKYYMFINTIYSDVRLVGVAPESIGKFGADTDNWMWPRHNGDFAMFRIYSGKDNLPAEYAEDNIPYTPKHFLPISLDGVEEGDFTLVFGFPGRTQEYLPSVAVNQIANVLNPVRIDVRKSALDVMGKHMRKDEASRLKYASQFAGIANYWKKWIGESQGINQVNAVGKKKEYELEFIKRLSTDVTLKTKYGNILSQFEGLYSEFESYNVAQNSIYETFSRSNDFMRILSYLNRLKKLYENNGDAGYNGFKVRLLPYLEGMYKNFNVEIDKEIFEALVKNYVENMDSQFIPENMKKLKTEKDFKEYSDVVYNSPFTSFDKLKKIVDTSDVEWAIKQMDNDCSFTFAGELFALNDSIVSPKFNELNTQINTLQKQYMKAQMEVFPEKSFFPDANSTLRITYGQVKGYSPRDAVYYETSTHVDGVMEKYKPGDYEFDLPQKYVDLYNNKDFGPYTDKTGSVPVCFIATNHTTGGNSGSPALDAEGNLIGLNFDRVWEGTMSDLYYDPSICRNIMVDARYILYIVDKYGNAQRLIDEMKLVHPKRK